MQRILWLVSVTVPQAAAACGVPAAEVSGGWLSGQLAALHGQLPLTVCSLDGHVTAPVTGEADGMRYCLLPAAGPDFAALLRREAPALVHIWGTEYPAAAAMQAAAAGAGVPVLFSIQGVMRDCAAHLLDGVPQKYIRSGPLQRLAARLAPAGLLDQSQRRFDDLAKSEAAVLGRAAHVTGRTGFDRRACAELAPQARYWPCGETLRPAFYREPLWAPRTFGQAPVILMTQGNYPLKNLHTALQAMPAVRRRWPGAVLRVAGWPPPDKGPLLAPVVDLLQPYWKYCKDLARALGLQNCLQFTGPLGESAMRQAFLDADVYLLPSTCENSPNSLGEAMLLGMPCVASNAGGIPDLLTDGLEGLLYGDACDADALAGALCTVLGRADGGAAYGTAARGRALADHDPAANARAMTGIYRGILGGEGP